MPAPPGTPVIIPEEGLNFPPAIWQVVFILAAPFIAAIALALPALIIIWAVARIGLCIMNAIDPLPSNTPLLYPPETNYHESA